MPSEVIIIITFESSVSFTPVMVTEKFEFELLIITSEDLLFFPFTMVIVRFFIQSPLTCELIKNLLAIIPMLKVINPTIKYERKFLIITQFPPKFVKNQGFYTSSLSRI